jgi:hypothetical protein
VHQFEITELQLTELHMQFHGRTLNFSLDLLAFPAYGQIRVCSAAQRKVNIMLLSSCAN